MDTSISLVGLIYPYSNLRFTGVAVEDLERLVARARAVRRKPDHPRDRAAWRLSRRLGEAVVAEIVANYETGAHTTELAEAYTISKSGVVDLLRQQGVTLRYRSMTEAEVHQVAEQYRRGSALSELTAQSSFSQETIRKALLRAGVTMRPARRE